MYYSKRIVTHECINYYLVKTNMCYLNWFEWKLLDSLFINLCDVKCYKKLNPVNLLRLWFLLFKIFKTTENENCNGDSKIIKIESND